MFKDNNYFFDPFPFKKISLNRLVFIIPPLLAHKRVWKVKEESIENHWCFEAFLLCHAFEGGPFINDVTNIMIIFLLLYTYPLLRFLVLVSFSENVWPLPNERLMNVINQFECMYLRYLKYIWKKYDFTTAAFKFVILRTIKETCLFFAPFQNSNFLLIHFVTFILKNEKQKKMIDIFSINQY